MLKKYVPDCTTTRMDCHHAVVALCSPPPYTSHCGLQIRHSGETIADCKSVSQWWRIANPPQREFHPPYLAPRLRPPTSDQAAGRPCRQGAPAPQPLPSLYIVSIFFLFYCCFISVTGTKNKLKRTVAQRKKKQNPLLTPSPLRI